MTHAYANRDKFLSAEKVLAHLQDRSGKWDYCEKIHHGMVLSINFAK